MIPGELWVVSSASGAIIATDALGMPMERAQAEALARATIYLTDPTEDYTFRGRKDTLTG